MLKLFCFKSTLESEFLAGTHLFEDLPCLLQFSKRSTLSNIQHLLHSNVQAVFLDLILVVRDSAPPYFSLFCNHLKMSGYNHFSFTEKHLSCFEGDFEWSLAGKSAAQRNTISEHLRAHIAYAAVEFKCKLIYFTSTVLNV